MGNFKAWLHGLGAAFVSAFCQTLSATLSMPGTFNIYTEDGLIALLKLGLPNALLSAVMYLRQSPMPAMTATVTKTTETTVDIVKS